MNQIKKISKRNDKERLYIDKMTELQIRWRNPISDEDRDFIKSWSEEKLDQELKETISQLNVNRFRVDRFRKSIRWRCVITEGLIFYRMRYYVVFTVK